MDGLLRKYPTFDGMTPEEMRIKISGTITEDENFPVDVPLLGETLRLNGVVVEVVDIRHPTVKDQLTRDAVLKVVSVEEVSRDGAPLLSAARPAPSNEPVEPDDNGSGGSEGDAAADYPSRANTSLGDYSEEEVVRFDPPASQFDVEGADDPIGDVEEDDVIYDDEDGETDSFDMYDEIDDEET